jgi:6-pyruvoyltetrahydropterin/6-carboxytetrahydropterin synthase
MLELTRTVRFSINPAAGDPDAADGVEWGQPSNTFAAYPTMHGLGRHDELDIRCRGEVDPATGYFVDIKEIDRATRAAAVPIIARACREAPAQDPAMVLREILPRLAERLQPAELVAIRWRLSPYYGIEMAAGTLNTALLRQQFEFAAAHRLHVPTLSDEQNRAMFGKCNNPAGHGHNYRVEPCVEIPVPTTGGAGFTLADLERLTKSSIIDLLDHKNLNVDLPQFAVPNGLNPSVENIAKVCYELLGTAILAAGAPAKLRSVTVWETDKTSCTYPA